MQQVMHNVHYCLNAFGNYIPSNNNVVIYTYDSIKISQDYMINVIKCVLSLIIQCPLE